MTRLDHALREGVVQISHSGALVQVIHDHDSLLEKVGRDLVLVLVVGADRSDESSGGNVCWLQEWLAGRCGGDDDLTPNRCAACVSRDLSHDLETLPRVGGESIRCRPIQVEHNQALYPSHQTQGFEVRAGLDTAAN